MAQGVWGVVSQGVGWDVYSALPFPPQRKKPFKRYVPPSIAQQPLPTFYLPSRGANWWNKGEIWFSFSVHLRRVGLEGEGNGGGDQASAEDVHGPLPPLGLRLLPGLDAPEPAAGGVEGRAVAALPPGGDGKAPAGGEDRGGLPADAAQGGARGGRGGVADEYHGLYRFVVF